MSIRVEASGRRSVQVQAEIPGTPEQVWQAISSGPGISSWFVPTEVEERVGGAIRANFGPGMESESRITKWDPPRSFSADSDGMSPDAPPMATEWVVEARSGGTCVVRVVHSWFAATDEWDGQFESVELGWGSFFRGLRLYLAHFDGQACSGFQLMGFGSGSLSDVWDKLSTALGLSGKGVGEIVKSAPGSPSFEGRVEVVGSAEQPEDLLLLSEPAPGIAHLMAMPMGGMTCLSIRFFFYGEGAAAANAAAEPIWSAWVEEHFPMPAEPASVS